MTNITKLERKRTLSWETPDAGQSEPEYLSRVGIGKKVTELLAEHENIKITVVQREEQSNDENP